MQQRTTAIRGLVAILMATLATLATIATALADVRSGPWPRS
jgi:hypothetical protein